MTKKELINIAAEKSSLTHAESKVLLDSTINVIENHLSTKSSLTIPHFGTFDVRKSKEHRFFNIVKETIMMAPQKYSIFFHISSEYKDQLQKKYQS
ncbi:HU family DNA-binding protein [Sulfurimonas sp.]|uniref:HU family DNA-binding protein n=1 Tax=Sulfurimonas sp. TaxID=2022749 RepID=UPI0035633217